jgi:hydrogenase small subunit
MDEPSGARFSTAALTLYGKMIRALRAITNRTVNDEPEWRRPGGELITGYEPRPGAYSVRPSQKAA